MSSLVSKLLYTALYVSYYPFLMGDICFEPLLQNNALFKILKFLENNLFFPLKKLW